MLRKITWHCMTLRLSFVSTTPCGLESAVLCTFVFSVYCTLCMYVMNSASRDSQTFRLDFSVTLLNNLTGSYPVERAQSLVETRLMSPSFSEAVARAAVSSGFPAYRSHTLKHVSKTITNFSVVCRSRYHPMVTKKNKRNVTL